MNSYGHCESRRELEGKVKWSSSERLWNKVRNMLLQEKFDRMDWISYGIDEIEGGRAEGWEERDQEAEKTDQRRVWKMHEKGRNPAEIADDMELPLDKVSRWLAGPKPALS